MERVATAAFELRHVFPALSTVPTRVCIDASRWQELVRLVTSFDATLETGGILLGKLIQDGYSVMHVGGPGPLARHARNAFLRDLDHARTLARLAWAEDRSEWLGEWHTHPSYSLAPSEADLRSYRAHLHDSELAFTTFLSIVVRNRGGDVRAAAWTVGIRDVQRLRIEVV